MKVDIYKRKQRFENWKETALAEGVPGLSRENSEVLTEFVLDMEAGRNTATGSRKGGRSYPRLCNLMQRMGWTLRMLQERGLSDVRKCDEEAAVTFFSDMERGVILTRKGQKYRSVGDYLAVFKAFWHWWMKVNRKRGTVIADITEDMGVPKRKPAFVHLTKANLEKLLPYFSADEQVLLLFLFDSMIRAPTEVLSLRAEHVYERDGEMWLTIPDEVSKTFGRTLNLLYSGETLRDYIARKDLQPDDPLFSFRPWLMNPKLQRVAEQLFGDQRSHAQGEYFRKITLYDFRHSGAVHFRLLAKDNPGTISLDALRHRGGWSDMRMLDYYTQFLGLDGKIEKSGMMLRQDKHQLEKEMEALRAELAEMKKLTSQLVDLSGKGVALTESSPNRLKVLLP